MEQEKLIKAIISFASLDDPELAERSQISFRIDIQPNSIFYGGEFDYGEGECRPIDLRKIGKYRCGLFTELLEQFHEAHTDNGKNKWNRARIKKTLNGTYDAKFIWDEEWERKEIMGHIGSESERGKWYWEEK